MKYFQTRYSLYEIDDAGRRIRRLHGENPPTQRQGPDENWKSYDTISRAVIGQPVVIVWRTVENSVKTTITSPVQAAW